MWSVNAQVSSQGMLPLCPEPCRSFGSGPLRPGCADQFLGERLHHAGFDVLLAATGPAALETARRRRPALTILDGALPGLDGEAVCRALRQDPTTAALLVVLLTPCGRAAGIQRITAFETDADDCVSKPFNPRELVLRVEALLRRARAVAPLATDQLLPPDDGPEAESPVLGSV